MGRIARASSHSRRGPSHARRRQASVGRVAHGGQRATTLLRCWPQRHNRGHPMRRKPPCAAPAGGVAQCRQRAPECSEDTSEQRPSIKPRRPPRARAPFVLSHELAISLRGARRTARGRGRAGHLRKRGRCPQSTPAHARARVPAPAFSDRLTRPRTAEARHRSVPSPGSRVPAFPAHPTARAHARAGLRGHQDTRGQHVIIMTRIFPPADAIVDRPAHPPAIVRFGPPRGRRASIWPNTKDGRSGGCTPRRARFGVCISPAHCGVPTQETKDNDVCAREQNVSCLHRYGVVESYKVAETAKH